MLVATTVEFAFSTLVLQLVVIVREITIIVAIEVVFIIPFLRCLCHIHLCIRVVLDIGFWCPGECLEWFDLSSDDANFIQDLANYSLVLALE